MNKNNIRVFIAFAVVLMACLVSSAQENTYHSVLSEHTWYKLSLTKEGVYKLDYSTLQAMGIDMNVLNPMQIRIFGNPSGALPEKNMDPRPDDLTEMAIWVQGADDGVFDVGDEVLFYGQEPTRWSLLDSNNKTYQRERNPYSDTTYYYLCVDSGIDGLRVREKTSLSMQGADNIISEFPDFFWHEKELMSPYFSGQNWFGEAITSADSLLSIPFCFPNLVKSKALAARLQVFGRTAAEPMFYNVWVENNHLADELAIPKYKDRIYARPSSFEKQFMLDVDEAEFVLSIHNKPEASLFLDYIEIYAWRQLRREGDMFLFRLIPSQFSGDLNVISVQNVTNQHWLWDVTNPLRPHFQEAVLSSGTLEFAVDENSEKRYVMFDPSSTLEVKSWTCIPNQNVHSVVDADMLVLTSPVLWEQANALADYHSQLDGMKCVVVDVNEIYNEFSTGTPDPTGIRDFVRMVYRRSSGRLKYLTLFGRASADYRNIMGYGQNYVPCYEMKNDPHDERSFCTDDFFGLMDDDEGADSEGFVDIGIGRISVSTPEEAETVLNKIRHYNDLGATNGDWKTNLLLFADDEETSFVDSNEIYYRMLDTICPSLNAKKVYCGAYPLVNTTTGVEIPGAKLDLMKAFNDGAMLMVYSGHGGIAGLTGNNVFSVSDINSLENFDRMPFVFTATCEFSKYDNPLSVSAGEKLFLNSHGGSVAMLTSCRPTYGFHNVKLGKALMRALSQKDDEGNFLRFGDIVRLAKSDPANYTPQNPLYNVNIRFLFLGDPALRFAVPQESIVVKSINGKPIEDGVDMLQAMSMVTLEGEVNTINGDVDTEFNGIMWAGFFDKETPIRVKHDGGVLTVLYHKDVLFRGKASVKEGQFAVTFQVPKDIMPDVGTPRFSLYAYDSTRSIEAMGSFEELQLNGSQSAMAADTEGPRIEFYWDSPDFINGDTVEHHGTLYANLFDEQGIYHYDYSLGRDIMLNSNLSAYNGLALNDRYEPALDDFRRGRLAIPVSNLESGTYEFNLKVWDTQDNASEAQLWFVVGEGIFLSQVSNYPNPFSEETYITLAHLGKDGAFSVNIEVFDLMGRLVHRQHQNVNSVGGVIEPIRWNGCDQFGNPLRSGVYLYRLTLTDEDGCSRSVGQRMIIRH